MVIELSSKVMKLTGEKGKISTFTGCISALGSSLAWKGQLILDCLFASIFSRQPLLCLWYKWETCTRSSSRTELHTDTAFILRQTKTPCKFMSAALSIHFTVLIPLEANSLKWHFKILPSVLWQEQRIDGGQEAISSRNLQHHLSKAHLGANCGTRVHWLHLIGSSAVDRTLPAPLRFGRGSKMTNSLTTPTDTRRRTKGGYAFLWREEHKVYRAFAIKPGPHQANEKQTQPLSPQSCFSALEMFAARRVSDTPPWCVTALPPPPKSNI